jgi:hypothetical protein
MNYMLNPHEPEELYHRWIAPNIRNIELREDSLYYMIEKLNCIINKEIIIREIIVMRSDSEGESEDSNNDDAIIKCVCCC